MESEGVLLMYQDMYERWLAAELDDADLKPELESVKGDDAAIQDRFAVALKFGTAGLRGVIGAGTNRMNIYVVRQRPRALPTGSRPRAAARPLPSAMTAASRATCSPGPLPRCWPPTASRSASTAPYARARAELRDPLLQLQRRYHGHGQPQPRQVQRLQAYGPDAAR